MKNRKNTYGAGGPDAVCAGEEEITEGEFGTDGRPVPYMPDGAVCQCGGNIFTRELRNGRIFYICACCSRDFAVLKEEYTAGELKKNIWKRIRPKK